MKILFVGSEVTQPWSEGRKNFARDLAGELAKEASVRLLTTSTQRDAIIDPFEGRTIKVARKFQLLPALHRALRREIPEWQPDIVCQFPYSTFDGARGRVNVWGLARIDQICTRLGVRCLTILYGLTVGSRTALSQKVSELVLSPSDRWRGSTITLGTDLSRAAAAQPKRGGAPTVLFMSGVTAVDRYAERFLLERRGLADLVEASPQLAAAGVRLLVAVPALQSRVFAEKLRSRFTARAPELNLEFRALVSVADIFSEADVFVFPHRVQFEQFVPTSILEAMAAGVPVVMSDLPMLVPLANAGRTAYLFPAGDGRFLGTLLVKILRDETGRHAHAAEARRYVRANWSIERSVSDLMDIVNRTSSRLSEAVGDAG